MKNRSIVHHKRAASKLHPTKPKTAEDSKPPAQSFQGPLKTPNESPDNRRLIRDMEDS